MMMIGQKPRFDEEETIDVSRDIFKLIIALLCFHFLIARRFQLSPDNQTEF